MKRAKNTTNFDKYLKDFTEIIMKYSGKFDILVETYITRFQQGGFLTGDAVRLRKNILQNPKLQGIGENLKDVIKSSLESDLNLRVASVKSERAATNTDVSGGADAPTGHWVDVVVEYAPGLWRDPLTLPVDAVELVEIDGINYAPIPDSLKRQSEQGQIEAGNQHMTQQNTKLKNVPAPKDGRDQTNIPG